MKLNLKSTVVVAAISLALSGLGASAAYAATASPGGGTWNYGNSAGYNYSDFNLGKWHTSSVSCGSDMHRSTKDSGWTQASRWSLSGCNYYYNY